MGNLIWFALVIPLLVNIILAVFFHKKMTWWEYLITIPVVVLLIFISKSISVSNQTADTEYWNGYAHTATYYEDWDEKVSCRHPIPCSHTKYCKDSEGDEYSCGTEHWNDGHYHPYDIDYHPKHWELDDNLGHEHSISEVRYNEIKRMWKNEEFKEMNRPFYSKDGDAQCTRFKNDTLTIVPVTLTRSYENRVQAAASIFNFEPVDSADIRRFRLYEYPTSYNKHDYPVILGDGNMTAKKTLQYFNGIHGSSRKLHMMILVYQNQPQMAYEHQKAHWKGGNKNEFILCVGVDSLTKKIQWANVISWAEDERLKIDVAGDVMLMKDYDIVKIAKLMGSYVSKRFVKRSFKEFGYLSVEPSDTAVVVTYILTFLISIGLGVFYIMNGVDKDGMDSRSYRYSRYRN